MKRLLTDLRNKKRIVLITSSGYKNIGQEAVVNQVIREIKEMNPQLEIISTSYEPRYSYKVHKFKNVKFYSNTSIVFLSYLLFVRWVIIAGDEINSKRLDKYYTRLLDYFQGKYKLFISFFSVLLGKKVIFYKIGICSFQKNFPQKILLYTMRKSKLIVVRDKKSKELLESLGVLKTIKIIRDPGYDLSVKKLPSLNQNTIGLSLSDPLDEDKEKILLNFLRRLIKMKQGHYFYFFIFGNHPLIKEENDLLFTRKIISKIGRVFHYKIIQHQNPIIIKSKINQMDFFISMRLHGAIFAHSLNVPFVLIVNKDKMRHYFEDKNKTYEFEELKNLEI
jgi:polysaccharide pyruvyl transferase WcaK-like protein